MTELRNIGAGRQVDPKLGVRACFGIKLVEPFPEIARRHANDGVFAGVVGGQTPKKLYAQDSLFEPVKIALKRCFHYVLQKLLTTAGSLEWGATNNLG